MSEARSAVLARVRSALGPSPDVPEVPRAYHGAGSSALSHEEVVERFAERVSEYKATVHRAVPDSLAAVVAGAFGSAGARRVAVAPGVELTVDGVEPVADDPPLDARALDALDGVLTGSALAIAETGTIVLDSSPACGRRALTLVPDVHVCLVSAATIVASVPDAIAALAGAVGEGRPITLVSGPSATSDIELDRVEGVHGPRTLHVVIVA